MAMATEMRRLLATPARAWGQVLSGWPLAAVALVWLTTAGHTMNFREMGAARGWVGAENYTLHSSYLIAVGLTLLPGPRLAARLGFRALTAWGLVLFAAGSAVNGFLTTAPLSVCIAGRVAAGIGGGLILVAAPGLLHTRWERSFTWASILLPPLGTTLVSGTSFAYGWSAWEGGFLFQGLAAVVCLAGILTLPPESDRPLPTPHPRPLHHLPWLLVAIACAWYCLHWGQLEGWLESGSVVLALTLGGSSLVWYLWLLWPGIDKASVRENWLRFVLMAFAGTVQFFHGTTMTIFSSLFVNYNAWQRFWLVWSMPIGSSLALIVALFWQRRRPLGWLGVLAGLGILAAGMALLNRLTLSWPFWLVQNVIDLNWFQAPLHWQQAPGRLVVGFGLGLLLASINSASARRPEVELRVRQLLPVTQTVAGGFSISLLVTWVMIGHQTHYSWTAEASSIQAQEYSARLSELREQQIRAGVPPASAERQALTLLYRSVNYQADNLTYAGMYALFGKAALLLAGLVLLARIWYRARPPGPIPQEG
jgi:DHA2 family multidrug resistance protein